MDISYFTTESTDDLTDYVNSLPIDDDYIAKKAPFIQKIIQFTQTPKDFQKYVLNITQYCDYITSDDNGYDDGYSEFLCKVRGEKYYEIGFNYCLYDVPVWLDSYVDHHSLSYDLLLNYFPNSKKSTPPNSVVYYFPPYDGYGYKMKQELCLTIKKHALLFQLKRLFSHSILHTPPTALLESELYCEIPSEMNFVSNVCIWFRYNIKTDIPNQIRKWLILGGPRYKESLLSYHKVC